MIAVDERTERNRLLWQCRRGSRELDTLLYNFVTQRYESLSIHDKTSLRLLLTFSNNELNDWLLYGLPIENETLEPLVNRIRLESG